VVVTQGGGNGVTTYFRNEGMKFTPYWLHHIFPSVFPLKTIFLKFHWSFDVFLSFKDREMADKNANGVGF